MRGEKKETQDTFMVTETWKSKNNVEMSALKKRTEHMTADQRLDSPDPEGPLKGASPIQLPPRNLSLHKMEAPVIR